MPLEPDVPPSSGIVYRLFARAVRRYFRRHFGSVMIANASLLENAQRPLLVYTNHSSWWDLMLRVLLARTFMPQYRHYAPMSREVLERYPILRKIGTFPIDTSSGEGITSFLRTSEAILKDGGVLWLTPQGRFADTREFPLRFKPGLATLAMRVPGLTLLPLACEYTHWDERLPEALAHVGEPIIFATPPTNREQVTLQLETALGATMLALQRDSIARDSSRFQTILTGTRGAGGIYSLMQRLCTRSGRKQ
jgi:1-acyl-sn-glycerol-3-phosphate acyltransferase